MKPPEPDSITGNAASAAPVQRLFALVYISKAVRLLTPAELDHLGERARVRNASEDVTGLLLYSDGAFMQHLEGPAPGMSRIYAVIKADTTHYGMIDLLREATDEREFAGWSMAVRDVGPLGMAASAVADDVVHARLAQFAPAHRTARDLLSNFWGHGRPTVTQTLARYPVGSAGTLGQLLVGKEPG